MQEVHKIYASEDSYVSSDKPSKTAVEIVPLLNIGRSENGYLNRAMLKFDLGDPSSFLSAELCLYQIFTGNRALPTDQLYVHKLNEDWNREEVTWDSAPSWTRNPINVFNDNEDLSTEKGTICITIANPEKLPPNGYGFMIRGEEDCATEEEGACDKKDRWFKNSEHKDENHRPYMQVTFDPDFKPGLSSDSKRGTASRIGITLGCVALGFVALGLIATLAFLMILRRRKRLEEEEESSVESEVEKDAIDKVGELFGIVSTDSDSQEDTFYTRDTMTTNNDEYTTAEGIEVRRPYTMGQRVQNMLFGVPEEETTFSEDYTYSTNNRGWYRS